MKNPVCRSVRAFTLFLALSSAVSAGDRLVFKDKTKTPLEGKVIEQTADSVKFEYSPFKGIKETVVVPRAEIGILEILSPDDAAFEQLKALGLEKVPDLLSAAEYQNIIDKHLTAFLTANPKSKHRAAVEGMIASLAAEMDKAAKGAVKIDGKWIEPEERVWNKYFVEGKILRRQMEIQMEKGELKAAIEKFDKLQRDYAASSDYLPAVDTYTKALDAYGKKLEQMAIDQPAAVKKRADDLKSLDSTERPRAEAALKEEAEKFKAISAAEKAAKTPILTANPLEPVSIKEAQTALTAEKLRISSKLDRPKLKLASEKFARALDDAKNGSYRSALQNLEEVMRVFPQDAVFKELQTSYKAAAAEEDKNKALNPVPTPPPASPPAKVDKPATPDKPATGDKPAPTEKPAGNATKPDPGKKQEPAKKAPSSPQTSPDTASDSSSGGDNTSAYILAGAGALALVAVGLRLVKKKKAGEEE